MYEYFIGALVGVLLAVLGIMVWKSGFASGYHSAYGQRGNDSKHDRKTQTNLALLRIKELYDSKMPVGDIAKTIVVEYPDVAFQALREAQKYAKEMGVE